MSRDRMILAMIRVLEKYGFVMDFPRDGGIPSVRRGDDSRVIFYISEDMGAFRVKATIPCVGGEMTPHDLLMASHEIMRAALAVMALDAMGLSYSAHG